jgi:hypothetical protein
MSDLRKRSEVAEKPAGVEPRLEPGFRPAEPGQPVRVTWAEEHFGPVPYNHFKVGPFEGTTLTRPGETMGDAVYRLWQELNAVAFRIREEKSTAYLLHLEKLSLTANGRR